MESLLANYKETKTSRGYKYNYYFSAPEAGQPTLLLIHGFPGLSLDWRHQIAFFKAKGYGLVAPDMFGYGGTDKPENHEEYRHSLLAKDLVDILDHEKLTNVFSIGHDWGSQTSSVLANLYADRFVGFGFLSVGYLPPKPTLSYEDLKAYTVKAIGFEIIGYWEFFASPDAGEVIIEHIDSFIDLTHAKDARLWKYNLGPTGAFRVFLESDTRTPRGDYLSEEFVKIYKESFLKHGLQGPTNYYRTAIHNGQDDAKLIPLENYAIKKPVFLGTGAKDLVCISAVQKATASPFCSQLTLKEYPTGHWVPLEASEAVNADLENWITSVVSS